MDIPGSKTSTSNLNNCPAELCIAVGREYNYGRGLPELPARVKTSDSSNGKSDKKMRVLKKAPKAFDSGASNSTISSFDSASRTSSTSSVINDPTLFICSRPTTLKKQKKSETRLTSQEFSTKTSFAKERHAKSIQDEKQANEIINPDNLAPVVGIGKVNEGASTTLLDVPPPSVSSLQSIHSKSIFPFRVPSSEGSLPKYVLPDLNLRQPIPPQCGSGDCANFTSNPEAWEAYSFVRDNNIENIKSAIALRKSDSEKLRCFSMPLLKQRLGYLLENKLFTDVIFIVGWNKTKIETHRIILASASEVFQSLLYHEGKPLMIDGKYILYENEFSEPAFEVFIKAMYTNEIPICLTLATALEVFYATKKYGVTFLENQVVEHIKQLITVSNVFEALRFSTNAVELTYLAPSCWKIIEEQTREVLEYHLENMDAHTLTRILERDRLDLDEVELFQTAIRWAANICRQHGFKTTGKNKRKFMDPLIKHFRFTTMTPTQFAEVVVPSRILDVKEIQQIQSSFTKSNESRTNILPYKTNPRVNTAKQTASVEPQEPAMNWNNLAAENNSYTEVPKIRSDSAVMIPHLKAKIGQSSKQKKRNQNKAR